MNRETTCRLPTSDTSDVLSPIDSAEIPNEGLAIDVTVVEIPGLNIYNAATYIGYASSSDEYPGLPKSTEAQSIQDLDIDTSVPEKQIVLIGRCITQVPKKGEPDIGDIVIVTLNIQNEVVSRRIIWSPQDGKDLLEDLRITHISEESYLASLSPEELISVQQEQTLNRNRKQGRVAYLAIGATLGRRRVEPVGCDAYAGAITARSDNLAEALANISAITSFGQGSGATPVGENSNTVETFAGKNVTPLHPDIPNLYIFRPDGKKNNHQLVVFERNTDGTATKKQTLNLSNIIPDWAAERIGTGPPPYWIDDNNALMVLHGYKKDESGRFIYSMGLAMLRKDANGSFSIDSITKNAIISPDIIKNKLPANKVVTELHPDERRVTYCCGGIANFEDGKIVSLTLFVNIGDSETVIVTVPVEEYLKIYGNQNNFTFQKQPFKDLLLVA